jgi:hypothetical protein
MSGMTLSPFREIAVHALKMREHRLRLALNLRSKRPSAQALRWHANQLAPKTFTPSNRRTVFLFMMTRVR